jgi:hypothetical protein
MIGEKQKHFFDIWMNEKTIKFREKLLNTENNNHLKCRECPIYKI